MDIKGRILQSLRPRRDGLLARSEVSGYGSPSQVSAALLELRNSGSLVSLGHGFFAKPAAVEERGRHALLLESRAKAMARAQQQKRRSERQLGGRKVLTTSVARRVRRMALREGVTFVETYADRFARAATQLAGDEVQSDETDNLLVELRRQGKLSPIEMVRMMAEHHRALKRV